MSLTTAPASRAGQALPRHLRPRREKVFGDGRPLPLDRNAKARITTLARALMRRTEKGKHYGQVTAKAFAVLQAPLVWGPLSHRPLPDLRRDIGIFTCRG
jgi:hypothetical protein